jgi:hypothetical protein
LEKNYTEELNRDDTIKLTVKSLLEVVQTGAKNIEISVMESYGVVRVGLLSFFHIGELTDCILPLRLLSHNFHALHSPIAWSSLYHLYSTSPLPAPPFTITTLYFHHIALLQNLEVTEIEAIVAKIESEKEADAERKRQRVAATAAGQASMAMGVGANLSGNETPQGGDEGAGTGDASESGIQ